MGYYDSRSQYSNVDARRRRMTPFLLVGGIAFIIGSIVGGFAGVFIFLRLTGGSAEASAPISAPTLSLDDVTQITEDDSVVQSPTDEPTASDAPVEESDLSGPRLFRIESEESQAQFFVYETFPEGTAVGRTNQIAGDIIIDFQSPVNSQLGTIRINLRTLQTDDPDRDRSIRCCVLLTAEDIHEFTDFVPVSITGLPEQVSVGETVSFLVIGNLTLVGNTRPVTFNVSVTIASEDEIRGTAEATVNRSEFGILNNEENGFDYHGVEEEVVLIFDFVARGVPE